MFSSPGKFRASCAFWMRSGIAHVANVVLIVYPLVNTRAAPERARENRTRIPRARALSSGVSSHPFRERYTFATTLTTTSQRHRLCALAGPELSGERFFACALRALFRSRARGLCAALRSPAISGGSVVPGGLVLHWRGHHTAALGSTSSGGQVPPHTRSTY